MLNRKFKTKLNIFKLNKQKFIKVKSLKRLLKKYIYSKILSIFKYVIFIDILRYKFDFLTIKSQNQINSYFFKYDNKLYYIFCFNNFYNLLNFYKFLLNKNFFINYYIMYNGFFKYSLFEFFNIIDKFQITKSHKVIYLNFSEINLNFFGFYKSFYLFQYIKLFIILLYNLSILNIIIKKNF